MEPTILSVCSINQLAMDFRGNRDRIIESIVQAKRVHKAKIRVGPELEVPGFSCEDHFLEQDTMYHSWQVLGDILKTTLIPPYNDILCLIGMPVTHRGVNYNCGIFVHAGRVVLIKPKLILGDDGNYRETRWFTPWKGGTIVMDYTLPESITLINGQPTAPFGNAMLRTEDGFFIGAESFDELQSPIPSSTDLFLQGAHIVLNLSASHFSLNTLHEKCYLVSSATVKTGGIYLYANLRGCDGQRLYFDGSSMIAMNGSILAMTPQFSVNEVDVVSAVLDLSEVDSYRTPVPSRSIQAEETIRNTFPIIDIPGFTLLVRDVRTLTPKMDFHDKAVEKQLSYAPACYLWDYLRRSGSIGYFLALSGGLDSTSVLIIGRIMSELVMKGLKKAVGYNYELLLSDIKRIAGEIPKDAKDLAGKIMHTAYLATKNSTEESKLRAEKVAYQIGSHHFSDSIDEVCEKFKEAFMGVTNCPEPKYSSDGGSFQEDISLTNIQSRSRMVLSYLMAQLVPWTLGRNGFLLVVSAANLEKQLTGDITKYDCSSGDINPIGTISKLELRKLLKWAALKYELPVLNEVLESSPTQEVQYLGDSENMLITENEELELTYEEIAYLAKLRSIDHCGPVFMFRRLLSDWQIPPEKIANKVKKFFILYGRNRHKMTVITPSVHIEDQSADDNRYDLRPFLYNTKWTAQFRMIDEILETLKNGRGMLDWL